MKTIKTYQCECGEDFYEDDISCVNCRKPIDKTKLKNEEVADIKYTKYEKLRRGYEEVQMVKSSIEKAYPEAYRLARRFHEFYERSAPAFGYITNPNTREFYPNSNNGRLMAWVCYEIVKKEKQELLKKLKAKFLETSTIGQHTLDVLNNYVNGLDLFDDDF